MSRYNYKRRKSSAVKVGDLIIGGDAPIRLQSMTNTSTLDTSGSVEQAKRIMKEGGELVRLTTQGVREAENLNEIRKALKEDGITTPLVADVHFNPAAAFKAVESCSKVRINPGNFADPARTFKKLEFTDEEYAEELKKIRETLEPFIKKCQEYHTAVRLGVNHGSLSDRIMSRYGDSPEGMVESVLEYLRIFRDNDFKNVVISIKSSNVGVMVKTVELLVEKLEEEDMHFPLHLGVTEAGDGEDGRIKSAVGIGTLLGEGLGDTIRVSLTEDPEKEIPVAKKLRDYILSRQGHEPIDEPTVTLSGNLRERAVSIPGFEDMHYPIVVGVDIENIPESWHHISTENAILGFKDDFPIILSTENKNIPGALAAWMEKTAEKGLKNPVILKVTYPDSNLEDLQIKASADLGPLLLWGYGNGIWIDAPSINKNDVSSLSLGLLQATRLRISKTEYIACPSCGRTLFDLQKTLKEVKEATKEMKGLKIGVMGCIVNGPGEMADADFGYVGAGPGKVSLYKGKQLVKKNIPAQQAIPELLDLINSSR